MIKIKKIDHVYLYVNSIEESRRYYEQIFDVKCSVRADREKMLLVENEAIHFFMIEDGSIPKEFVQKQHISFEVPDIQEIMKALGEKGIDFNEGKTVIFKNNNYQWCEWLDVNGINIECVETLS